MDIFDNVIPFIPGEENKIQAEACKILGSVKEDLTGFINQPIVSLSHVIVYQCLMAMPSAYQYDLPDGLHQPLIRFVML